MTHEMHRDYFHREMRVGRRVVVEWSRAERWPDMEWIRPVVIDGLEFRTEDDAARFDLDAMTGSPGYDLESWGKAEIWVAEEPTPETRNVHEQLEDAKLDLLVLEVAAWLTP